MRSSIFDEGGPSMKNIYNPNRQHDVLAEVERLEKLGHQPPNPEQFNIASPADFRLSQNAGHNAVFGPGTEDCPAVHAVKEPAIPREYWKSDVNLHWADPRNEINRSRRTEEADTRVGVDISAKERGAFEMSSELFDWERMTHVSTAHPSKELQSCAEHFLANQTEPHDTNAKTAEERLRRNLDESQTSTFKRDGSPEPMASQIPNEDPTHLSRRRHEKNFSDIFGTQMPERVEVKQRSGATDSLSCSWLDARAEVEARERAAGFGAEDQFEKRDAVERRLNELQSRVIFGSEQGPRPDAAVRHRLDSKQGKERITWETTTLMESGSELARRAMGHDFGNEQQGAWARKVQEQASTDLGEDPAVVEASAVPDYLKPQRLTLPTPDPPARPMSAAERKQKNLGSQIFF
jgi:hypothetical protein